MMSSPTVLSTVRTALKGAEIAPWQRHLAFALAESMDEKPTASAAKELRLMMAELLGDVQQAAPVKDAVDDISARIAARRSAAGS